MTKEQKFLLLVVLIVAGAGSVIYVQNEKKEGEVLSSKVALKAGKTTGEILSTTKTLETAVTYSVPENHTETLKVIVALKDGVITDISFSENPSNKESREYYTNFSKNFSRGQFIGKTLENVSLSRVGGASLTTRAFNAGIADIKKQANS